MSLMRNNAQTGTAVLGDVFEEAVSTSIADGASSLWSGIKSGLGTIADGVRSAYNYVTDGISNTATGIVNLFGSATAAIAGLWRGRRQEEWEGLEEDLRLIEINDRLTYLNNLLQNGIQLASLSSSMSTDSDITPEQAAMLEMENARKERNALLQEQNEIISGMETAQREANEQKLAEGEEGEEEFDEDSDDSFTLMESPMGPGLGAGGFNIFRPSNSETNIGESGSGEDPVEGSDNSMNEEWSIADGFFEDEDYPFKATKSDIKYKLENGKFVTENGAELPLGTKLNSEFGPRKATDAKGGHAGIDLRASIGTPIPSTISGKVTIGENKDWGKYMIVDKGDGIKVLFAHLSEYKYKSDQVIKKGDIIGLSGDTGYYTKDGQTKRVPPHLHYAVFINGKPVNPLTTGRLE